jgi:TRAP-type transport system periplasmic protein
VVNQLVLTRRASATGLLATAATGMTSRARADAPIQLKLATGDTMNDVSYDVGKRFGEEVSKRTNGKYEVAMFVGGALGSILNLASSLTTGIIDAAILTSGYVASIVPSVQFVDLPFIFKDQATAERLLDGDLGKRLFADMEPKGVKGLAWGWYGWRQMQMRDRAVHTPDDMRGMKMRIQPSPVFVAMFKALGAIPVPLDGGEVYLGLSQQTVQGVDWPLATAVTFKVYEVTKYLIMTNHVYNAGALMVSQARWNQLTAAERVAFQDAANAILPFWRSENVKRAGEAATFLQGHGMQPINVDYTAFQAKMKPVYDQFEPQYPHLFKLLNA